MIRERIIILDQVSEHQNSEEETVGDSLGKNGLIGTEHVSLSSVLKSCTVEFIETTMGSTDNAFKDFRKHLGKALTAIFNSRIEVSPYGEVNMPSTFILTVELSDFLTNRLLPIKPSMSTMNPLSLLALY